MMRLVWFVVVSCVVLVFCWWYVVGCLVCVVVEEVFFGLFY